MKITDIENIENIESLDFHHILVDLINSLSIVKSLSEVDNQQDISEKQLVLNVLNVLISNQDMERCSFFTKTDDGELVNLVGLSIDDTTHKSQQEYKPQVFKMGEGLIGLAAETGELMHSADCKNDERFSMAQKTFMPGAIISAPIHALGELFGVLNISHPEANYFSDWHIHLLQIYKNLFGQLISNYRMFKKMEQQISKKTEYLQRALNEASLLQRRFESLSMIDSLTGLYNRRFFYEHSNKEVAGMQRYGGPLCIVLLDLDCFKKINDEFGHACGDQVLIDVANKLKNQMRKSDIVARFGGEEFVILFSRTDGESGLLFAERIRQSIASLEWTFNQKKASVTASIGICCIGKDAFQDQNETVDSFVNFADIAMYKAKSQGKNQVVVFTESLAKKDF